MILLMLQVIYSTDFSLQTFVVGKLYAIIIDNFNVSVAFVAATIQMQYKECKKILHVA